MEAADVIIGALIGSAGAVGTAVVGFVVWLKQQKLEAEQKRRDARGARWDDGQAKAVQQVNEHLALLGQACSRSFEACDDPELLEKGWGAWWGFIHTVNVQGIFFEEDLLERLHQAHEKAWSFLNSLKIRQDESTPLREKGEFLMEAYKALNGLYLPLRGELRERFQALLRDAPADRPQARSQVALPAGKPGKP